MPEPLTTPTAGSELRSWIEEYDADRKALSRRYPVRWSSIALNRTQKLYEQWLAALDGVDFQNLSKEGRIDWLLFENHLKDGLAKLSADRQTLESAELSLGCVAAIAELENARKDRVWPDPKASAATLNQLAKDVSAAADKAPNLDPIAAASSADVLKDVRQNLETWHDFYNGYDPAFTWWVAEPWKAVVAALDRLKDALAKAAGDEGDNPPIVGRQVGREGLLVDLQKEWMPNTPEQLIAIGEAEMAWCEAEFIKASRELGCGDDWKAAIEKVKETAVPPGEQIEAVKQLALEAEAYLRDNDLMTVPELASEVWQVRMMSPEQQKVAPFFYGGETISVSYPTDTMTHEQKLMSMRGNNPHFSRATVHHELIPGHHMQGFLQQRYFPYRGVFRTPFWIEGWTLYWELFLWDHGFPRGPEDRIGMLFWRLHRAARIVFSLKFHMGQMTAQECVDFLVEKVGHERANAEGEVRRSFRGGYDPLYQAAYMIGGKQVYALQRELVASGWTVKQFHDAFLRAGVMPIEMLAASLRGQEIQRPFTVAKPLLG